MKYINKEQEPETLSFWFNNQMDEEGNRLGCDFRKDLPGDVKRDLHDHLLREQGFLCCYTGILIDVIDVNDSHIEHLKPYSLCKRERQCEDVSYRNLLAAYPGKDRKNVHFGAHAKEDWYDPVRFVSPLDENCEKQFIFYASGKIAATDPEDIAAKTTIDKLVLNHDQLKDLRKAAIQEVLFNVDLEESELQEIANGSYSVKDEDGKLPSFCFVIEQIAKQLISTV